VVPSISIGIGHIEASYRAALTGAAFVSPPASLIKNLESDLELLI
jgi:hypothetical protein